MTHPWHHCPSSIGCRSLSTDVVLLKPYIMQKFLICLFFASQIGYKIMFLKAYFTFSTSFLKLNIGTSYYVTLLPQTNFFAFCPFLKSCYDSLLKSCLNSTYTHFGRTLKMDKCKKI